VTDTISREIESLVLAVHWRNGGKLSELDWNWRLLEPALGIDSLDLAEIVVALERRFQVSLFDLPKPPRTWADVRAAVGAVEGSPGQCASAS
jgi:acyl carrier protein